MASKRRQRRKACEGKVRHSGPDAAFAVMRALTRRRLDHGKPYPCRFCKGWHIGHPPGSARFAIQKQRRRAIAHP